MSNNQIKQSIHKSINVEINPLVIQLKEFGYDNIYSRRVFYYLHPEDIEEALNYMSIENGIIQHQFVKDKRNISNEMCYICNENEEIHLKELNKSKISNVEKIEEKSEKEEEKSENKDINSSQIKKSINNINSKFNNNKLKSSFNTSKLESSVNTNDNNDEISIKSENNNQIKNSIDSSDEVKTNIKNYESEIKILNNDEKIKINLNKKEEKKECEICNEIFQVNEFNKLENCGHSFCSSCWYDSLSVKIKENKLTSIKCLDYNCPEKLPDSFIVNILKDDNDLLKIYKKYKLELEVIENPNKKLCPYPNCDSYLELKNIHEKDVSCLNNHTFCFLCLKKPHGNLPCNENDLDKSIMEFAKNNFVKKCPKCNIIIEKNKGCNHITCAKCGYQWCWLCNEEYNENHFNEGKCKGFQFYQPKNDYDIKLVMEGKINASELSNSQRQFDDGNLDNWGVLEVNNEDRYQSINCCEKIVINLLFLIIGYSIIILMNLSGKISFIVFPIYILFSITFFIQLIYFNLISFILILIFMGYKQFILRFRELDEIYLKKVLIIMFSSLSLTFIISNNFLRKAYFYLKISNRKIIKRILFFPYLIISSICFFPYNIFINISIMLILLIEKISFTRFYTGLENIIEDNFSFIF